MGSRYSTLGISSSEPDRPPFKTSIPLPKPLDINGDIAVNFEVFKSNWKNYFVESELEKQSNEFQTTVLRKAIGTDATMLYFDHFLPNSFNCASPAIIFRNIEREILPAIVRKRDSRKIEEEAFLNTQSTLKKINYYPEPINVQSGDIVENVKKFQLDCFIYWSMPESIDKSNCEKLCEIRNAIGPDAKKYYDEIKDEFTIIEKSKPILLLNALVRELPKVVFMERKRYNRSIFYSVKQMEEESFVEYFSRINDLIKNCYFGSLEDDFLIDKIICSVSDEKLKAELLRDEKLSLQQVLDKCTKFNELIKMPQLVVEENENASGESEEKISSQEKIKTPDRNCKSCGALNQGDEHDKQKTLCPAYGARCYHCKEINHFKKCCKKFHEDQAAKKERIDVSKELKSELEETDRAIEYIKEKIEKILK